MDIKKTIKGIAKNTGKYTLKGLGKGMELAGRGGVKTIRAIANNQTVQKVLTGAGMLAASIAIPAVGVTAISLIGMKMMIDAASGKNKGIMDEIGDLLNMGNRVTRTATRKILNPILGKTERGMKNLGRKYQGKMDQVFR